VGISHQLLPADWSDSWNQNIHIIDHIIAAEDTCRKSAKPPPPKKTSTWIHVNIYIYICTYNHAEVCRWHVLPFGVLSSFRSREAHSKSEALSSIAQIPQIRLSSPRMLSSRVHPDAGSMGTGIFNGDSSVWMVDFFGKFRVNISYMDPMGNKFKSCFRNWDCELYETLANLALEWSLSM